MFAQAALCLSGRACPGLENLFLMLYREYRYSIEKKNREVCGFLSYTQEYRYSLRFFFTFVCVLTELIQLLSINTIVFNSYALNLPSIK